MADPVIEQVGRVLVVRDDLHPGGTKARVVHVLFDQREEYVYASPVYGYAQVALAYAARLHGKRASVFCARRSALHPLTQTAASAGAIIRQISPGYLTVVQAKARAYCQESGACLLPFGLADERIVHELSLLAQRLPVTPREVWSVAGSGTLTKALQRAWPTARFFAVRVGKAVDVGSASVYVAPEKFEQPARVRPPFPSCLNYDAKAWRFVRSNASDGALFWNVAA